MGVLGRGEGVLGRDEGVRYGCEGVGVFVKVWVCL